MADYRQATLGVHTAPSPFTPSPFGIDDHGDPESGEAVLGPTPGPTGLADPGDPERNPLLGATRPAAGGGLKEFGGDEPAETAFARAIALYEACPLFDPKDPAEAALKTRIVTALKEANKEGRLEFVLGQVEDGEFSRSARRITITQGHRGNPAATTLWLVHEGYHLAVVDDKMSYVDEEIASRMIQGPLCRQLQGGVAAPDGTVHKLSAGKGDAVLRAWEKNQIVDFVIPVYKSYRDFKITADWIIKHKADWGGFRNRTPATRAFYAQILVDAQPTGMLNPMSIDPAGAETLLELLEAAPKFEVTAIATAVGKDEVVQILDKVPAKALPRAKALKTAAGL